MKIKYQTERLIVREWEDKDYKDLYEFASDKVVTKFLAYKTYESVEDAKTRIATLKEKYKTENRYGDFAIELKSEKKGHWLCIFKVRYFKGWRNCDFRLDS